MNFNRSPYPRTLVWSGGPATTALIVITCAFHASAEQAHAELSALGMPNSELHLFDEPTAVTWEFNGHKHEDRVYLFAIVRENHAEATAAYGVAARMHRELFPAAELDALEQEAAHHFAHHPDPQARKELNAAIDKARKAIHHVRDNVVSRHHTHAERHKVKTAFDDVKAAHATVHATQKRIARAAFAAIESQAAAHLARLQGNEQAHLQAVVSRCRAVIADDHSGAGALTAHEHLRATLKQLG